MTYPTGPGPRRRMPLVPLVVGVSVALFANGFTLTNVDRLRAAWDRPSPPPTASVPSRVPTTRTPSPTRSPSASKTPSAFPTKGSVTVTDELLRGIVLIEAATGPTTMSSGTGMVISGDGRVVTNYHVVRSTSDIVVIVAASKRRFPAKLLGRDATKDVALLQIEGGSGFNTITPDTDPVEVGNPVIAAGNAAGQGFVTAFSGSILAMNRSIRVRGSGPDDPEENLKGLIETDAHAEPGDSGGPLFDAEGEVVGMTTAGSGASGGADATAFAVPFDTAMGVVERVVADDERGTVVIGPKPSLGITAASSSSGVRVKTVASGSAAERAGLQPDDTITRLGSHAVESISDLAAAIDTFEPGDSTEIAWTTAAGKSRSGPITLDESPYN